ncbi:MAG: dTMP kinase [Desulfobacteraceae bacterium]|jgi:dTMP kinase
MLKKGFVVAIEGIDGAGKTTQAQMLYTSLQNRGIDTILSKEPTDSIYGDKIRELAQGKRQSSKVNEEYRLFVEDRKLHVKNIIKPALNEKKIVILDRYYFSTMAYQGALGLNPVTIKTENEAFSPIPEIVFIISVPPTIGIGRIRNGRKEIPNAFEHEENLKKVAAIFNSMTFSYINCIDGTTSSDQVHRYIISRIESVIEKYAVSP